MTTAFLGTVRTTAAEVVSTNGHRRPRTPVAVVLGRLVGQVILRARGVRSAAMQTTAFGCGVVAFYQWWGTPAALMATCVSLFVLEWLTGDTS